MLGNEPGKLQLWTVPTSTHCGAAQWRVRVGHNCRQSTVVCLEFCELEPFQGANKLISTSDDVRAVSDSTDAEITADVAGVEGSDPTEQQWTSLVHFTLCHAPRVSVGNHRHSLLLVQWKVLDLPIRKASKILLEELDGLQEHESQAYWRLSYEMKCDHFHVVHLHIVGRRASYCLLWSWETNLRRALF